MKRIFLSLAVAAVVAGPIAASATSAYAQDRGRRDHREQRWDRHDDRRDRHDSRRGHDWNDRRDDRRGHRSWDRGRHNGYYYNNRWSYGPPPQAYYGHPGYRPGYAAWRRGSHLPPYYRSYVVRDYHRYHLRQPPRGYAWYRVGDDYLLTAIASGVIFDIIGNN